jgi:hypothetical protein
MLTPPASPIPHNGTIDIFETYDPINGTSGYGGFNEVLYSTTCWALPSTTDDGRWPLHKVCWHDNYNPVPTTGNGVAITPRHVLVTEHGTEVAYLHHSWVDYNGGQVITRWAAGARYQIDADGGSDTPDSNNTQAFRMLYLSEDLPPQFVCPLMHPGSVTDYTGFPVIVVNQGQAGPPYSPEAVVLKLANNARTNHCQYVPPTDGLQPRVWRHPIGGDSGSPVFFAYNEELI